MCYLFTLVVFACGCQVQHPDASRVLLFVQCAPSRAAGSGKPCDVSSCHVGQLNAVCIVCPRHRRYQTDMDVRYKSMADGDNVSALRDRLHAMGVVFQADTFDAVPPGTGTALESWVLDARGMRSLSSGEVLAEVGVEEEVDAEEEDVEMGEGEEEEPPRRASGGRRRTGGAGSGVQHRAAASAGTASGPTPMDLDEPEAPATRRRPQAPRRPAAPSTPAQRLPTSRGGRKGVGGAKSALEQEFDCDQVREMVWGYVGGRNDNPNDLRARLRTLAAEADPHRSRRSELRPRDLSDFLGTTWPAGSSKPLLTPRFGEGKDVYLALLGLWKGRKVSSSGGGGQAGGAAIGGEEAEVEEDGAGESSSSDPDGTEMDVEEEDGEEEDRADVAEDPSLAQYQEEDALARRMLAASAVAPRGQVEGGESSGQQRRVRARAPTPVLRSPTPEVRRDPTLWDIDDGPSKGKGRAT